MKICYEHIELSVMRKKRKIWLYFSFLSLSSFILYLLSSLHRNQSSHITPDIVIPRNLPKCLVIGVRKGGTRALIDMMGLHSKIKPAGTEIHFFDSDTNFLKGLKWYSSQIPILKSDDEISVEKTPSYFVTEVAPERVRSMNKSIRLLLIVRDPVTRLVSDYAQILDNHRSKNLKYFKFESLALRPDGTINTKYDALSRSIYVRFMKLWLKHFSLNQFHIVNGDRLIKKPWHEIRKVEKFLNLPHEIMKKHFYFNASKGFHCLRTSSSSTTGRCLAKSKGRQHPNISSSVVTKLRTFFKPYNYEFYDLVNMDFGWPED
ncbi:heparan sulfate glucosamine 3-O-sulfotransferase 5 [Lepeophtheirus salmonis]|uniref:heparan sulfate glucosamine 3-O-sulfotransferase 5 n=1 Tax=Lepeophtheirus salmonis TaxID=72036 RepID=UPI001AE28983|nr:heparan sulfate glucosamine 3-O-sulfotransferase 5-like [Lepeophtheirus salmonis]